MSKILEDKSRFEGIKC